MRAVAEMAAGTPVIGVPVGSGGEVLVRGALACGVESEALRGAGYEGKAGEVMVASASGSSRVVAIGVGEPSELDAEGLRRLAAALVRSSWRSPSLALVMPRLGSGLGAKAASRALAEGALLASYRFGRYKASPEACRISSVEVLGADPAGIEQGRVTAEAVILARDLVNEPAGSLTPARMAERAVEVASASGLEATVWDKARISQERLGGLLGVAAGSAEEPRLVQLRYTPAGSGGGSGGGGDGAAGGESPLVALVGKGITFDSGGLSLKGAEGMANMKTDMGGAAAVIGAMSALAALEAPVRVVGILPLTENMPGGRATKPGDVLRARNNKTIEVLNTDAEGRLVLADGLSLAAEMQPVAIVDLATLTGACIVALGREIAGLMGNDQALLGALSRASEAAGEPTWPLPLPKRYRKHIDSEVADMKNIGAPGQAGTIAAALLLQEFVGGIPWAHLDIAGPSRAESDDGYLAKGATGFGVRTLIELLVAADFAGPVE
ncbi:MAG: leucyl aminopeptidase [Acidimicrobiales bacterium]